MAKRYLTKTVKRTDNLNILLHTGSWVVAPYGKYLGQGNTYSGQYEGKYTAEWIDQITAVEPLPGETVDELTKRTITLDTDFLEIRFTHKHEIE